MQPPEVVLSPGLLIRQTFAHVFAPYMLAFSPPATPRAFHPGPWKAATGGLAIDVKVEVLVQTPENVTQFDPFTTLWWVLALIRLRTGSPVRMPIISDIPFNEIATHEREPRFWPDETSGQHLLLCEHPPTSLTEDVLTWVRDNLARGAPLMMNRASFNRAFQVLDSIMWSHSRGAAIVLTWAAVETIMRPGRQNITAKLAGAVADYLEPRGPARDRLFQQVRALYETRGGTAHASRYPAPKELYDSVTIARAVFTKVIEQGKMP